ncbi:ATP-binding cassette domain-containing protein [Arcanobacterium haemolyticum]
MVDAVEAINLTKRYKDVTALNSMNLTIPEGVVFGVIGPNGAGKSTFMRILCDLVRPTGGTVS